ncbi:hypothetical protein [Bosea sp. TAB14]|jgi:hypothetical protein|uniref:hypothetical protein n=1 Tax=Bosea sp. TAB14 TaxID=3237481 RepID=UPI003F8EBCBE
MTRRGLIAEGMHERSTFGASITREVPGGDASARSIRNVEERPSRTACRPIFPLDDI